MQLRLREEVEVPGSTVTSADIRYATTGIDVEGLPAHSPLVSNTSSQSTPHDTLPTAQNIGNLLASDTASINVSGSASGGQVDWYQFQVNGFAGSTILDVGYADGLTHFRSRAA